jgi:hypothetical protein
MPFHPIKDFSSHTNSTTCHPIFHVFWYIFSTIPEMLPVFDDVVGPWYSTPVLMTFWSSFLPNLVYAGRTFHIWPTPTFREGATQELAFAPRDPVMLDFSPPMRSGRRRIFEAAQRIFKVCRP